VGKDLFLLLLLKNYNFYKKKNVNYEAMR